MKFTPQPWYSIDEKDFVEGKELSPEASARLIKRLIKERNCANETSWNTNEAYVKLCKERGE